MNEDMVDNKFQKSVNCKILKIQLFPHNYNETIVIIPNYSIILELDRNEKKIRRFINYYSRLLEEC